MNKKSKINNYCIKTSIKHLRHTDKADWLDEMKSSFSKVHYKSVSVSQIKAWDNEFDVLQKMAQRLPEKYDKIRVVFEYVMPMKNPYKTDEDDPGVRPDVLLLSDDTVVVLEFKQREEVYKGVERQVRKYRTRLQKWHVESIGMNKKAILVLTKSQGVYEELYRLKACSPDTLADAVVESFGEKHRTMKKKRLKEWLQSEYAVKEKIRRVREQPCGLVTEI